MEATRSICRRRRAGERGGEEKTSKAIIDRYGGEARTCINLTALNLIQSRWTVCPPTGQQSRLRSHNRVGRRWKKTKEERTRAYHLIRSASNQHGRRGYFPLGRPAAGVPLSQGCKLSGYLLIVKDGKEKIRGREEPRVFVIGFDLGEGVSVDVEGSQQSSEKATTVSRAREEGGKNERLWVGLGERN